MWLSQGWLSLIPFRAFVHLKPCVLEYYKVKTIENVWLSKYFDCSWNIYGLLIAKQQGQMIKFRYFSSCFSFLGYVVKQS